MHFQKSLRRSIYAPWKDYYIDYAKLKKLLRDAGSDAGSVVAEDVEDKWTEEDEGAFVEELVNVQLEKVHDFQSKTIRELRERTTACEAQLESLLSLQTQDNEEHEQSKAANLDDADKQLLRKVETELDAVISEMSELEKFSRINYTGFLKATKKHDRKRGHAYRVRPLMQVRLAALPFNKEDYSPLLSRISIMYGIVRQNLESKTRGVSFSESVNADDEFTSTKFWVHPDNLLELKTVILRRLPALIFNPQTSKVAEGGQKDPTVTSIYFDNPGFSLYNGKVTNEATSSQLRLRWYGHLSDTPDIYIEKKTVREDDISLEQRFTTKPKYVKPFLRGDYKMEKDIQRLRDRAGDDSSEVRKLKDAVDDIAEFVKLNDLQPVLRANYTRTAFQIPQDHRVRITIDTNLALIREDALNPDQPCRDPDDWYRRDIDDGVMEFPFEDIPKAEISRFPYAVLEIRTKGRKKYEWVQDLMNSHLVKPAPRFSKFVHGVAQLFDDYVNTFPFWLAEVDTDIRRDPQEAFEEEQEKKSKAAMDDFAVGSLLRGKHSISVMKQSMHSPAGSLRSLDVAKEIKWERATPDMTKTPEMKAKGSNEPVVEEPDSDEDNLQATQISSRGFRSFLPSISLSKYARAHRQGHVALPPGVVKPSFWIKDQGVNKVEAKVWLANQRTFIKWAHASILMSLISLGLYNSVGEIDTVAFRLAVAYLIISLFTAFWGYGVYMYRCSLIQKRSGKDLDQVFGPAVVCIALIIALSLNLAFKYQNTLEARNPASPKDFINGLLVSDGPYT